MKRVIRRRRTGNPQEGITMIELLIAGVVMVVGFMALIGLVVAAIASNTRNRLDTSATMLDLFVVESIESQSGNPGTLTVTDCVGTSHQIQQSPGGATLSGTTIDYSQAASAIPGYQMDWAVCNGGTTANAIYDVRWHIDTLGTYSFLVTTSAKLKGVTGGGKYFALPTTIRTITGK